MGEVAAGEEEIELERKSDGVDDFFYLKDENGKKQLIEIDDVRDANEKCYKTTWVFMCRAYICAHVCISHSL